MEIGQMNGIFANVEMVWQQRLLPLSMFGDAGKTDVVRHSESKTTAAFSDLCVPDEMKICKAPIIGVDENGEIVDVEPSRLVRCEMVKVPFDCDDYNPEMSLEDRNAFVENVLRELREHGYRFVCSLTVRRMHASINDLDKTETSVSARCARSPSGI